ncbi:MAG: YwiC-like family protein [Polyangiaceae bacterium]
MRPRPETAGPRSLAPREHGAYGQLFVPLAAALAMGRPTVGALGLGIAGSAVFFAHEPLLILLGKRGDKARREAGARAKRRLGELMLLAAVSGVAAALTAPMQALIAAVSPLVLGAFVGWLVTQGKEKTTVGEMAAAAALAGVAIPAAIAAGVPVATAWGAWGAWTVAFGASTWAVRAVIAHQKARTGALRRVAPLLVPATLAVAFALTGTVPWFCAAAAAPMILVALAIAAMPPHPRALKRVGWSLVGASVAAAAILVTGGHLVS